MAIGHIGVARESSNRRQAQHAGDDTPDRKSENNGIAIVLREAIRADELAEHPDRREESDDADNLEPPRQRQR